MGTLASVTGSKIPSSPPWRVGSTEEKGETDSQHDKLPVLQLCPDGAPPPRGVTAAVTLPAKAMAAMKETRELEKSIVRNVWLGM